MAGRVWEALPLSWEGSGGTGGLGGPPVGPGGVGSPSWRPFQRSDRVGRTGRGWEALLESQVGSGGQGQDGWPSRMAMRGQKGLGGPPGGMRGFERPFRRVGRGQEALLEGQEGSRGTEGVESSPRNAGRTGRLSRRAGQGWEALLEGQKGSVGPSRKPRVVGSPTQKAGSGWEALPENWEKLAESLEFPQSAGRIRNPSWRAGKVWRPFQKARRDREGWKGSGVPTGGPG